MLYFFHGQTVAVVSHGCTKERIVPVQEIELAIQRKSKFEKARTVLMTLPVKLWRNLAQILLRGGGFLDSQGER